MATIKELQTNACADVEVEESEQICDECVPNSMAIVPDWTTVSVEQPYLNEKTCEYEVTIQDFGDVNSTPITAISDSDIESANSELILTGLRVILEYYGKSVSESDEQFDALTTATYVKDYAIPMVSTNTVSGDRAVTIPTKVLIAIPALNLNQIEDITENSKSGAFVGRQVLEISAFDLKFKLRRLKNALRIFSKFQAISNFESTRIYYQDTQEVLYIEEFKDYVSQVFPALQDLVEAQGDYVMRPNRVFKGIKNLTEVKFVFDDDTVIQDVYFYSYGCEDEIKATKQFSKFQDDARARNRVVSGLIASIIDIDDDLSAREPIPWYEFVEKYFNVDIDIVEGSIDEDDQSALGCFLEDLQKDTKIFDQLLNQVVSLPEIVADKFAKYACMSKEDIQNRNKEFADFDWKGLLSEANIQADFRIDDPLLNQIDQLLAEGVDPRTILNELNVCGLTALMLKIIECLAGQLSFEDYLRTAVKSALKNMNMRHTGKLYNLLPASSRAEILVIVNARLIDEGLDGNIESADGPSWPWKEDATSAPGDISESSAGSNTVASRDTLLIASQTGAAIDEIIPILIDAMLEVVGAEALLEYLNTFPGSELIARILEKSECINPPRFSDLFPTFVKSGDLPFCRSNYAITLPALPQLVFQKPNVAIARALLAAALDALIEQFRKIIISLLAKLIYYLKSNLCSVLEDLGTAAQALATGADLLGAINASVCGDDGEDTSAAADLFASLGSDQDSDEVASFVNNISVVLTAKEICSLLKGQASDEVLNAVVQIIKYNNTGFLNQLTDAARVRSFFINLGNYISQEEFNKLCGLADRAAEDFFPGASICKDRSIYDEIRNLRKDIMSTGCADDATIEDQLDKLNERTVENLEQIMDILQGEGAEGVIEASFPQLFSSGDIECPTVQGIFAKDDPVSSQAASEGIEDLLDGIEKKFERDMVGRKGFFDYLMCAADGTRLKQQLWGLKHPLFSLLDEKQSLLFSSANGYLASQIGDHNYFPLAIGGDSQTSLQDYASSVTFDSSIGNPSVQLTFTNNDGDYTSTIEYTHSKTSDPNEDESDLEIEDTISVSEGLNEEGGGWE
jgi:hypothetical protein